MRVRLADGTWARCRVVAAVPEAMSGGPDLLLPPGLVPADQLADAPTRTFVTLAPGADPAPVAAALARSGTVRGVDDYLAADAAAARARSATRSCWWCSGLGGLYALIGVVNSVVIAAAARRREFAEARVTGMTRGQVVRAALLESSAVTAAGLVLGGLAAGSGLHRGAGHHGGGHRHGHPGPALDGGRRAGRHGVRGDRRDQRDHLLVGYPAAAGGPARRPGIASGRRMINVGAVPSLSTAPVAGSRDRQ